MLLKAALPKPDRLIVLRNCLGMIMSVSMFCTSNLAATPLSTVNCLVGSQASPSTAAPAETVALRRPLGASVALCMAATIASNSSLWGLGRSAAGRLRTSVRQPETAAAAAMAGETRWVRPPVPWRPSKLRLDVEAHLSWGSSLSGFIARHMEQPGSRQSNPASIRILSRPSFSACALTSPEPGTTIAYTCDATLRPLATCAAARTSSIRALVQEPMKTLSTLRPSSLVPGVSPMYSSERLIAPALFSSTASAGSGTMPVMGTTSCGLVPHVSVGAMSAAAMRTSLSYVASGSEDRVRQ
mmetsp:Transcript_31367/g.69167  ORF Transcript_31367/g.69167 Transcript_31367/m.69167 type:complete len:299 (+) Transcript_31367:146-1042(+)